jgi:hypothetical protein
MAFGANDYLYQLANVSISVICVVLLNVEFGAELVVSCRTTSPESCALEFYVRSGRDSRFQRLGPAFLHSPAATSFLDVQVVLYAMFNWTRHFITIIEHEHRGLINCRGSIVICLFRFYGLIFIYFNLI